MNHPPQTLSCRMRATQRGFTLVELMVTVAIALFLLYGLVTTVQNVRQTSLNQQKLAQLQDAQRFAMTAITDVIQAGGYYFDPHIYTPNTAFADSPANGTTDVFNQSQAFSGLYGGGTFPGDRLDVRFLTGPGDGVLNCLGGSNTTGAAVTYYNTFSVVTTTPALGYGELQCSLSSAAPNAPAPAVPPVTLVTGVVNMQIFYGVKRNLAITDYNVDTYLRQDQMLLTDWPNISSIRVVLTFVNPLYTGAVGSTIPQYITLDRVVEVMARAGNYIS
jgi:type IV pilus assembly protein PilW